MITLNPHRHLLERLDKEYAFVLANIHVMTLLQFESHMRTIHILCAKITGGNYVV